MAPIKKITKHTPYKASVGKRLEILRNQLGLDMQTMAARMSVTVWTYRAYRKGDRLPSTENLDQLTRTRNISLDWLFAGRGDMFYRDAKQALKEAREAERAQQAGDFFLSELEEMKHIMQRVPIVRHLVMANYQ
ncbi:MAG: helix-turn-helix transcriptional regulator, partial [bacterium]|nr:helix-turn-helix transcriptional regulator [bacterium]